MKMPMTRLRIQRRQLVSLSVLSLFSITPDLVRARISDRPGSIGHAGF